MQGTIKWMSVFLLMALLTGCVTSRLVAKDSMARRVASLVDSTTQEATEARAFTELESLGSTAVPYLIGHLSDERALPVQEINLANTSPDAFEGIRSYAPKTVHDALSAILNQITGQSFGFVYNGSSAAERESNRKRWQDWCAQKYPDKAWACRDFERAM
jgi:hypothetical protein